MLRTFYPSSICLNGELNRSRDVLLFLVLHLHPFLSRRTPSYQHPPLYARISVLGPSCVRQWSLQVGAAAREKKRKSEWECVCGKAFTSDVVVVWTELGTEAQWKKKKKKKLTLSSLTACEYCTSDIPCVENGCLSVDKNQKWEGHTLHRRGLLNYYNIYIHIPLAWIPSVLGFTGEETQELSCAGSHHTMEWWTVWQSEGRGPSQISGLLQKKKNLSCGLEKRYLGDAVFALKVDPRWKFANFLWQCWDFFGVQGRRKHEHLINELIN